MGVEVEGLRQLVRDMEKAGVEVQDLKDVFSKIAAVAADTAATYAPSKSGNLRNSIRGNKAKNKAVVFAGKAKVPYAGAINYGWPKRNIRGSQFMQRADKEMEEIGPKMLDEGISDILTERGLT